MLSEFETAMLESIQRKLARIEVNQTMFERRIEKALELIYEREKQIMALLTDLQSKAAAQGTALDALTTAIAAIPTGGTGGGLSAADQAVVDSTAAEMTNNDAKIAAAQAAVAALTPPPAGGTVTPAAKKA